jgi:hypothetical protein
MVRSVVNDPSINKFLRAMEVMRRLNAGSREGRGSIVILRSIGRSIHQLLRRLLDGGRRTHLDD